MQALFISYLLYTIVLGFASQTYYFINKVQLSNEQRVYLFICPPFIWAETNKQRNISLLLYYAGINLLYFLIIIGFRLVPFDLMEYVESPSPPSDDVSDDGGMAEGFANAIVGLSELTFYALMNVVIWGGIIFTTVILPPILAFISWLFSK